MTSNQEKKTIKKATTKKAQPSATASKSGSIKLQQIASGAGKGKKQIGTLIGLGLNKLNKISELQDTVAIRGMITKVKHLVKVIN
jgi:large subunit ribosomal protein L30